MKKNSKNNKGFSLVELIVVVLIMAIIAVALAPQVMKWVENSRLANDVQTGDAVVSAMQIAYATDGAGAASITLNNTTSPTPTGGDTDFWNAVVANLGGAYPTLKTTGETIQIAIDANGLVTTTYSSKFTSNSDLDL